MNLSLKQPLSFHQIVKEASCHGIYVHIVIFPVIELIVLQTGFFAQVQFVVDLYTWVVKCIHFRKDLVDIVILKQMVYKYGCSKNAVPPRTQFRFYIQSDLHMTVVFHVIVCN